ncbi:MULTISPECIES: autotransporter domain-containing protein [unclassified Pseudomonas]|uniref:autotransporter outer membrane beta-barrel domain-containing protein n=1 Tax=unclassified Pseudomonas TaxID=196821 RepID=UPI000C879EC7|nr:MULTISPECIES: autotransporter outer membrane beta-barrel domain-containing protein [unclassified Pseudomonas]PMU11577.1 autotransporter outer membrane beta-barrel domain-containing protein [Pseudomonas sp. FW305-20]PMU21500.1 autotransporter outer membrane beta-barrel domain-containing protein [Pseudomonas sp. FW305-122]PMU42031.1 autotransporter outer membrane beta-barrel domain-containing protein [Pseudomonas sp. FW305-47B]PMX65672.1 autotransporter outer membrane beta-barrel domain-contai
MSAQHKFRPKHLALAVALTLGCTQISLAQQLSFDAIPSGATPEQLIAAMDAFINDPATDKNTIGKASDGIDRKFGDGDDLVIVSGRGALAGLIDGGGGINFLQLDTASGGTLGESRRFEGLELKRSTWTMNGSGDFNTGVLIRSKATLINNGDIQGGALSQGTLVNNGRIGGSATVQSGGTLNNPGTIEGDVVINEKGAFAGNGVTGSLTVNGKLSVDGLHGAPKVRGDLNLSKTAELTYEVNPDRKSETILVGGTADLGGATLNIVAAPGDYPLLSENTILAASKVEGEFGKVINNLAFLTPKLDYQEKKVDLILLRNDVPIENVATTDNGKEVAQSIEEPTDIPQASSVAVAPNPPASPDTSVQVTTPTTTAEKPSIAATPHTTEQPVTAASPPITDQPVAAATQPPVTNPVATVPKASSPTNAAVVALLSADKQTASIAIEQLAGGQNANLAKATLNSDSPISATMLSAMRQLDSANSYINSSKRNAPRLAAGSEDNGRVWLQALGHGGTLDRDYDALKHTTHGLVLGADWGIDEEWRIGVMSGKSETRLDSRGLDGDLDSWHLGAYALRQNGPMSLRLGATYSNHDGSTKRRVAFRGFSDRPEGRYDANTQQAFAELGYNLGRANVSIEPFASLGYQRYQRDTYTEKGGAAALKVQGQTQNNLNSTFGLRLAKLNTLDNGMQLTPRFSAGWKHTYGDIYSDTRQRLVTGGKNFSVSGASLDRDSLLVDAGLDLGLSAKHTLGVGLTGEVGTDSRNHGVTGQWRMSF